MIILALALSPAYPIIKNMWTIPFNLLTLGIGAVLFSICYYIIDVKKHTSWTLFFRVFGMNAITIYLLKEFVSFGEWRWYDIDD